MIQPDVSVQDTQYDSAARIHIRQLHVGCSIVLVTIAILRALLLRYNIFADAISYLDMARAIAEGHTGAAINSYWSPGYTTLLAVALWVFRPNAYWEAPLAHFVNVLIFMAALGSFQLFWREVRQVHRGFAQQGGVAISENSFWMLGYSAFAIATLNVITMEWVNPDLLVGAFCSLAGWCALRFRRSPNLGHALLLGIVLAAGYYSKAPFFPMGLVFIVCACFGCSKPSRAEILFSGTAMIVFLLACAPYITALSRAKGHFTFGESARLAQAFYMNGVQYYIHWQGGPPGAGVPMHPTRKLNDFPAIYEFAAKGMGTYPPWYDPTYWYQGVTPHSNWKLQSKTFVANLTLTFRIIVESGAVILAAVIVLALLSGNRGQWALRLLRLWFVWGPGAVALLMFAFIHVEPRFLGGWLILLFAGAICASVQPRDNSTGVAVGCVALATVVMSAVGLLVQAREELWGSDSVAYRSSNCALIADSLLKDGLHPGDPVAVIGGPEGQGPYWAHLARLQVVAEIPYSFWSPAVRPVLDFWESGPEQQQKALGILEQTGAKAVIAGSPVRTQGAVPSNVSPQWRKIDGTWAYVYFFRGNP